MKKESLLVNASIQGDLDRSKIEIFYDNLTKLDKVFKYIRPLERAELINFLCQRNRNLIEIEQMITPIALIYVVQDIDIETLTNKFDQLLRLWNKPATEAMNIADILTKSSQSSASTFEEMLDAMIAFQNPSALNN